jgi:WD40 repeat protein
MTLETMDITKARVVSEWKNTRPLLACRFDPSGKWAVTSSEDFALQRWELAAEKPSPVVMQGHESWVHALVFSQDGTTLVSGGCDGKLIWWSIGEAEPKPIRIVEGHRGWVRNLALSIDGKSFASCGNDKTIAIWDMAEGKELCRLTGHERDVYSVLFHPNGRELISGDLMGKLHVWDIATRTISRSFDAAPLHTYEGGQRVDFGGVRCLAINQDGTVLAAGGLHKASNPLGAVHEPLCLRFDYASGQLQKSHVAEGITGGVVWNCRFLQDGTLAGVSGGSTGGFLLFWNAESDKQIHKLPLPNIARDMDVHPDRLRIGTSHHDTHFRITALFPAA